QRWGHEAVVQPRESLGADSQGAAARRGAAPAPAAFEPDQEANAERDAKAGNQLVEVHGRPGNQIRTALGVTGPSVLVKQDGSRAPRGARACRPNDERHMNVCGRRRAPRTWLAIQART